jgi:penicillin-binding protein 1A
MFHSYKEWIRLKTSKLKEAWADYSYRNPRESRIVKWTATFFGAMMGILLLLVLSIYVGVFGPLPGKEELSKIENANASEIYSYDGVLLGKFFTENRKTIELDSISPYLVTALLAVEDKRFFEHSGIDLRSWLRVFVGLVTSNKNLGGGSTLSQQLAKNLYPRKKYGFKFLSLLINKLRENIISIRLEDIYNKEELLIMYLNTVPFGGTRFGIQEASRYFYNKSPGELTADESATLIGMLKATTALDPVRNPNNSLKRRNLVLSQMLKNRDFRFESKKMQLISDKINNGTISEEDYQKLIDMPVTASQYDDIGSDDGIGTYFREYLRVRELPRILENVVKEDGETPYNIYTDGLKIYTTVDSRMQEHAEKAVHKHLSYLQNEFYKHWKDYKEGKPWGDDKWIEEQVKRSPRYKGLIRAGKDESYVDSVFSVAVPMKIFVWEDGPSETDTLLSPLDSVRHYFTRLNCGFMAMEPGNGYIKAWVGGIDFKYFKYDHILSRRQSGSTFKPIVYAAALQEGMSPCDYISNRQVTIEDWSPHNADYSYGGYYSLTGGLAYSVNVVAAQLIEKVGIEKTITLANKMGVSGTLPREYGISLGSAETSLQEMMAVYGTFANKGVRPEPTAIVRIEDRNGKVIYDRENAKITPRAPEVRVLDSVLAYTMTRMLENVVVYGTANAFRSQFCNHCDFAGKTGTTQNHSDGWFLGYNPELITGVWVGGPSPAVRFRSMNLGSGSAMALPVAGHFWYKLATDKKFASLTQKKFVRNEKVHSDMTCPLKLEFEPSQYYAVMKDSILRDSMMRNGFNGLNDIMQELFGEKEEDNPEETENGSSEVRNEVQ